MTYLEAQALIDSEMKECYPTSPLTVGYVDIIRVGEDGFLYFRETEHIKSVGIAEILCNNFTTDINNWRFSEIVLIRKNIIK